MVISMHAMCVVKNFGASVCVHTDRERCSNHKALPLVPLLQRLSPCVGQGLPWASCFAGKKLVWHARAEPCTPVLCIWATEREREWVRESSFLCVLQCFCFYTFPRRSFGRNQFSLSLPAVFIAKDAQFTPALDRKSAAALMLFILW